MNLEDFLKSNYPICFVYRYRVNRAVDRDPNRWVQVITSSQNRWVQVITISQNRWVKLRLSQKSMGAIAPIAPL